MFALVEVDVVFPSRAMWNVNDAGVVLLAAVVLDMLCIAVVDIIHVVVKVVVVGSIVVAVIFDAACGVIVVGATVTVDIVQLVVTAKDADALVVGLIPLLMLVFPVLVVVVTVAIGVVF